jgi:hypothetical protein
VAHLCRGDVTQHDAVFHTVTLSRAALYMAHRRRDERLEEFRRQQLYEVINRSMGGEYEADRSLLQGPKPQTPKSKMGGWIQLSDLLGCPVPDAVREKAHG